MEFGVPFITVPIKRTLDGLKTFTTNAMKGELPKPHFNFAAITLIGILCLGFSSLTVIMRRINEKHYLYGTAPNFFHGRSIDQSNDDDDYDTFNLWHVLETIERALAKYNIDGTACIQHSICQRVQESLQQVSKGRKEATTVDIVLEGISRTDWILDFISGSAIEDAIHAARYKKSCDNAFPSCKVNLKFFYSGVQNMVNNVL